MNGRARVKTTEISTATRASCIDEVVNNKISMALNFNVFWSHGLLFVGLLECLEFRFPLFVSRYHSLVTQAGFI